MLILGPEDGAYGTSTAGFMLHDKLPLDGVAPGACDALPEPQLVELRTADGVRAPEASATKIQLNNVAFPDVDRLQARTAPAPIPALVKTATGLEWLATGINGNEAELLGGKTNIAGLNRFRARIARIERCQTYLQYLIQEIRKMMRASDHGTADSLLGTVMARPVLFAFQKMSRSAADGTIANGMYSEFGSAFNLSNASMSISQSRVAGRGSVRPDPDGGEQLQGKTFRGKKITIKEVIFEIISHTFIYFVIIILATIALFLRYRVR